MENLEDIYELSPMQQGMLFHTLYNPQSNMYFEQTAFTIRGCLNPAVFKLAWQQVLDRHPILRTSFYWEEMDKPLQVVHHQVELVWRDEDWRGRIDVDQALDAFLLADQQEGFQLDQSPLMRLALIRFDEDAHYCVWSHHHLLLDGWSVPLLLQEAFIFYETLSSEASSRQTRPHQIQSRTRPRPYRDYILWLQQQNVQEAEAYWQQALAGIIAPTPLTSLNLAHAPNGQPSAFGEQHFALSPENTTQLQTLARQHRLTLNTLVQGAWALLLSRYSREEEIVFGATVSGRPPELRGAETMVGLFINTLPVCVHVPEEQPLLSWLQGIQLAQVERERYAYTPLVDIQNWSNIPRGTALFESIVVFENYPMDGALPTQGLQIGDIRTFEHTNYPLTVEAIAGLPTQGETERTLSFKLKYDSTRFDSQAIANMGRHLQTLLTAIADNPERQVKALPLLTADERLQLLHRWQSNDIALSRKDFSVDKCLHHWFLEQVQRQPNAIALVYEDQQLTYQELNQRANQLAHTLQSLKVGPDTLVGLCLERSPEMVIAVLGILKAGGAYLPLDTAYPQERLDFMLSDAQAPVLLTQASLVDKFSDYAGHRLLLDEDWSMIAQASQENPECDIHCNSLAYVIYTSGSTGKPKGVMVSHANVTRLFTATNEWYHFNEQDVWTLFHSIAFDFSVWELWGALLYGGRLVVVPYLISRSPEAFYRLLVQEQVTVLNQTPSAFRQLMRVEEMVEADLPDQLALRSVIFGGEALEMASLKPWFERHGDQQPQLVNMYGITETTVHVTYRPLTWADVNNPGSVIGGPIPDLQIYILDANLEPTPVGIAGEMYVGGEGVSQGYLNRPELSEERFISHPFHADSKQRLYKTGDLARYLPNGDIEYLGRIDHQVKIRGFRIELGEIETALAQHPAVREQIVMVREDEPSYKRLVAYVVLKEEQTSTISEMRDALQQKLPDYMVPAAFVTLVAIPLTPNGKIDYRALPLPEQMDTTPAQNFVAPRTAEEQALAEIWGDVLDTTPIGIYDNFFELGGDSILSIQVLAKAKEKKLNFSLEQLFEHQNIYELAQHVSPELVELPKSAPFSLISEADRQLVKQTVSLLENTQTNSLSYSLPIEDAYPLTRLQSGMLFHSDYSSDVALYHNVNTLHLRAPFDENVFRQAVEELVASHPVLRTAFEIDRFSEPLQLVYQTVTTPLTVEDLRHLSPDQQENTIQTWFEEQKATQFAWHEPPLIRFYIHQRGAQSFQFSWAEHHAIVDGWSVASMITELLQRYLAGLNQDTFVAPTIESSFRDYVALEGATLASPEVQQYWTEQLNDAEMTQLPRWPESYRSVGQTVSLSEGQTTGEQTDSLSYDAPDEINVSISPEVSEGLKALAKEAGVPLKSVLLAAHLKVLSVMSNQSDVLTGLAWNGRLEEQDGERALGLFLNTLPFRLDLIGGSWLELVQESFAVERSSIPFRRYPYADIQKQFGPLFESAFNFTHFHIYEAVADVNGMKVLNGQFFQRTNFTLLADFSLDLFTSQVLLDLSYDSNELDIQQVAAIGGYYARTLEAMASQPDTRYEDFSPLSEEEQHQLLVEWNETATAYPREQSIQELFEQQVERTPDAIAVVMASSQSDRLTYRALNERANQLAHYLKAEGVGTETLVGICVERSLEMVIGLLGILKAGGTFVPFDPAYPSDRLAFMLEDTAVSIILTQQRFVDHLPPSAKTFCLDLASQMPVDLPTVNLDTSVHADNLAYIMYTSGSTGKPKGVCVTHRNVVRLVQNTNFADLSADKVFLQLAPISFDASTFEIWGALLNGASLVVMPPHTPSLEELGQALKQHQVNTLWLTSGLFHLMVNERLEDLDSLQQLLAGGDVLSVPHVQKVIDMLPNCELLNGYGPTENTTFTCCFPVKQMCGFDHSVPIGHPIANTQVYILDKHMQPVPVGVFGELYAGGDGVARGYYNRPKLTQERFITDPFKPSGHDGEAGYLYKTGDLARYLPTPKDALPQIEFLGRMDNQVKIRGFRIELGEIETILGQLADVRDVVAIVREDQPGNKRIVAYVVPYDPQTSDISPERLRDYLQAKVPEYMIPSIFVPMDALPLNPNGKVDRRALPIPDLSVSQPEGDYVAPRTTTEETLTKIWADVLNLEQVGIHDNFFTLGGDSILSIQIITRARQAGIQISARQLFESQTIAEVATVAKQGSADDAMNIAEQGPVVGDLPLTPIQHWFLEQAQPEPHHFNQSALFEVPAGLSPELLRETVQSLLIHHDALRLRFAPVEQPDSLFYRQTNAAPDENIPFSVIDLSHLPLYEQRNALDTEASNLQASLNLTTGPLLHVALFILGYEQPDRLLIIVHHLAIDGVSWRILSEDLETAYQQLQRGERVQLPPKTTSFKAWAHLLSQEGVQVIENERAYWQSLTNVDEWPLPIDANSSDNLVVDSAQLSVSLSAEETHALLYDVPDVYNTQVNDLLLTALVQTFAAWTGNDSLLLHLEGHGREELFDSIDLSRTVGWFTSIYPVRLRLDEDDLGEIIKSTKEQLRQIPRQGIGYGILRYLGAEQGSLQPEISFNYLGQFQSQEEGTVLQRMSQDPSGALYSPHGIRHHLLDIVGMVVNGELHIEWIYNQQIHQEATILDLANSFKNALAKLIAHCQSPDAGGWTLSDFPDADLDQDELEMLLSSLE